MSKTNDLIEDLKYVESFEKQIEPHLIVGTPEEMIDRFHQKIQEKQQMPNLSFSEQGDERIRYRRPPRVEVTREIYTHSPILSAKQSESSLFFDKYAVFVFSILFVVFIKFYVFP